MPHRSDVLIAAVEGAAPAPTPLHLVAEADCQAILSQAGPQARAYWSTHGFTGKAGQLLLVPDDVGGVSRAVFGLGATPTVTGLRALGPALPPGDYAIASAPDAFDAEAIALAFALGSYRFDRYKAERGKARARLAVGPPVDLAAVERVVHACDLARDLVNTPANDMGPLQLETVAREIAHAHEATVEVITGDALLAANYPAVHAVGRAATPERAPRLIELRWTGPGADAAPLVAVVGKGVVFDTGGLDIKPSSSMRNMKKDMGGAAHALALARMIMDAELPVRLAVLVPAVENVVAADAMRPGDVISSRRGLSIEIGNTDAEGRLILADALTRAGELGPDLTIDLATLTGAARVALGPDVPPFYTADEGLAAELDAASRAVADPLWRMPLWPGYADSLNSDVADLKNDADAWAQAGSITAALFLQRFAPEQGAWVHLDIFAWNPRNRPGWPAGGEAQAIRALFAMLQARYGAS